MPINQKAILIEQERLGLVNAQAVDFKTVFTHYLGDIAQKAGLEYLARYQYTPAYSNWAVAVSNAPDDVAIVGEGLELIINPTPQDLGSDAKEYKKRWRVLVKDHSTNQSLIHPVYTIVQTYLFPYSSCMPYVRNEELDIEQAIWRIDVTEVPIIRNGKRFLR